LYPSAAAAESGRRETGAFPFLRPVAEMD